MFSLRAVPTGVTLRGVTAKAPSQSLLKALTRKYGDQMSAFDTTRIYSLTLPGKAGELSSVLPLQARAIVIVDASSAGRGGANFSIVQLEGGKVIGGSTFVVPKGPNT